MGRLIKEAYFCKLRIQVHTVSEISQKNIPIFMAKILTTEMMKISTQGRPTKLSEHHQNLPYYINYISDKTEKLPTIENTRKVKKKRKYFLILIYQTGSRLNILGISKKDSTFL